MGYEILRLPWGGPPRFKERSNVMPHVAKQKLSTDTFRTKKLKIRETHF